MKRHNLTLTIIFILIACQTLHGQKLINHGPYLQRLGTDQVTIVWTTNTDCISWVEAYEYDGSNFYNQERPRFFSSNDGLKTIGRIHKVTLNDLKPGTRYAYRIFSKEVVSKNYNNPIFGRTDASVVYQRQPLFFTTEQANKEKTSVIVMADIHGRASVIGTLLSDIKPDQADFIVLNGDFVSAFNREEELFNGGLDTLVSLYATARPLYFVRGNHETRGTLAPVYKNYLHLPENKYYYSFSSGNTLFIVLDCGEDKPNSDIEYSDLVDFDSYRDEEARWLQQLVNSEKYKTAKHRIVFLHMPPVYPRDQWHGEIELKTKILPILNKAGIDLMISGHTHRYAFIDKSSENEFPVIVLNNNSRMELTVDQSGIKTKVIDVNKKVLSEFSFPK